MHTEGEIAEYISKARFEELPPEPIEVVRKMVLTIFGTTIAGSNEGGCAALTGFYKGQGGKAEATVLIRGGALPAQDAAFVNGYVARAVDYCDAMAPGMHIGASAVPTALAAAELAGGCSGKEFLCALVVGAEIATRLNLSESAYSGLDPTGICAVFGATASACKLLRLSREETLNGLALAFNRSGGSLQSNVDASLAVRCIQGWTAQNAITCARFAKIGITGPGNFLEGVYGYYRLYGKGCLSPESVLQGLGEVFNLRKVVFKKYPSCGLTQGCTDAVVKMVEEHHIELGSLDRIEVRVPSYTQKLVGHPFRRGDNPRVNAQFSIQYCTANALLRKGSRLHHFDDSSIDDPALSELIRKVAVVVNPDMEKRGHTAVDMLFYTKTGERHELKMDTAPGFPGNPLTAEDHENHFRACLEYARPPFPKNKAESILASVRQLESLKDVRALIPSLLL